jgi:hypothetical protein
MAIRPVPEGKEAIDLAQFAKGILDHSGGGTAPCRLTVKAAWYAGYADRNTLNRQGLESTYG